MIADCKYCSKTFSAKTYRKIFCSDRCKVAYNRETRLTCFYCGDLPGTKDHITPHSTTGLKRRIWAGVDWVNCCRECNTLMGAAFPYMLSDRIAYLIEKFSKRYKLDKPRIQWDEDELDEMSMDMRREIRAQTRLWNARQTRLDHMRLRHLHVAHKEMESSDKDE